MRRGHGREEPWIPASRKADGQSTDEPADTFRDGVAPGDPAPVDCGDCETTLRFERFGPAVVLVCPECVTIRHRLR